MTFVFDDPKALQVVCGPNDSNIEYIQEATGCVLAVRGNAVYYSPSDPELENAIGTLFERLVNLSHISDEISHQDILMELRSLGNSTHADAFVAEDSIKVGTKSVCPKGQKQSEYIRAMKNSQIVFAIGPAGTGKTFLAVNWCLGELLSGKKQKIILTRPVVEAGENLGFIPGDLS